MPLLIKGFSGTAYQIHCAKINWFSKKKNECKTQEKGNKNLFWVKNTYYLYLFLYFLQYVLYF
jgi:hypothetical protein